MSKEKNYAVKKTKSTWTGGQTVYLYEAGHLGYPFNSRPNQKKVLIDRSVVLMVKVIKKHDKKTWSIQFIFCAQACTQ